MSERHLDPRLSLRSRNFVESLLPELLRSMGLKRVRAGGYGSILSCVIANMIKAGDGSVIVRLSKHVRYEGLSQVQLRRVIPAMDGLGWIALTKGKWRGGEASTFIRKNLDLAGLETTKSPKEILVVRKQGLPVNPDLHFTQDERGRMLIELRELNKFLATADITRGGEIPDLSERELRRIFDVVAGQYEDDPSKDYAGFGRLYGAFWIGMKKAERANIRIEGEPVAYLDFSAMNVRLGYFLAGALPPSGDLYDLTGFLAGYEDTYEWRAPVKKFASSIWFAHRKRWPKGIWFPGDVKGKEKGKTFPYAKRQFEYMDIYRAFTNKHPILKKILARPKVGFQMAHIESDIMVDILLRLRWLGIVGLPIHDGLLVKQSQARAAGEILDQVTLERLGWILPHKTNLLKPKPEPVGGVDFTPEEVDETQYVQATIDLPVGIEFTPEEEDSTEITL
jgi:hypothetical protein